MVAEGDLNTQRSIKKKSMIEKKEVKVQVMNTYSSHKTVSILFHPSPKHSERITFMRLKCSNLLKLLAETKKHNRLTSGELLSNNQRAVGFVSS